MLAGALDTLKGHLTHGMGRPLYQQDLRQYDTKSVTGILQFRRKSFIFACVEGGSESIKTEIPCGAIAIVPPTNNLQGGGQRTGTLRHMASGDPVNGKIFRNLYNSSAEGDGAALRPDGRFPQNIKEKRRDYSCACVDGVGEGDRNGAITMRPVESGGRCPVGEGRPFGRGV